MKGRSEPGSGQGAVPGAAVAGPGRKALWDGVLKVLGETGGTCGVSYLDLGTGERFEHNAGETFYAASVIKVPVMCEVFRQAEAGRLDLARAVRVERDDQVGGSGVLQVLTPGVELPVYDLVTLMIVVSDNTAMNMLLDMVGPESVTAYMAELGLTGIRVYHKLMIVKAGRRHENVMTPKDTTELMALIARERVVSMRACEVMIDILKRQQYHDHLTKYSNVRSCNTLFATAKGMGPLVDNVPLDRFWATLESLAESQ